MKILFILLLTFFTSFSEGKDQKELLKELNALYKYIKTDLVGKSFTEQIFILNNLKEKYGENPYANELIPQLLAEKYSYVSKHKEAITSYELAYPNKKTHNNIDIENFAVKDAINRIIKESKKTNILMINEAHHNSQHRVLTFNLLEKLKKNGYGYLAIETLVENGEADIFKSHVNESSGTYVDDPIFSHLLIKAKELGFKIVSYDYSGSNDNAIREDFSAKTIVNKVFNDDKSAKVIIHCGYNHISEVDWLASKLKEITSIDPLTVNQTSIVESFNKDKENMTYETIANKIGENKPIILENKNGEIWSVNKSKYDISVIWPKTYFINGRANWSEIGRKSIMIETDICKSFPCQVEVFNPAYPESVPLDRVMIEEDNSKISIFIDEENNKVRAIY